MKLFTYYFLGLIGVLLLGCQEDLPTLQSLQVPMDLQVQPTISTDGSGLVTFNASASNTLNYHFFFGNGANEDPFVSADGLAQNFYKKTGTNTYLVKVVAFGPGGISSSTTLEVEVFVDFKLPDDLRANLFGSGSKKWYWKQSEPGHLGVGPLMDDNGNVSSVPSFYAATPDEKASEGCLYEDAMTFTDNGDGTFSFVLDNNGNTYFHTDEIMDELGVASPGSDACFMYDVSGTKDLLFSGINSGVAPSTGINMEIGGRGFLSYFVNASSYEIMSVSAEELRTRVVQDINGFELAWYHIFTSNETIPCSGLTGDTGTGEKDVLIWSDEFDGTELCQDDWSYEIGTGSNGWGNGELQYYTDRSDNLVVSDGTLKITAKREAFEGEEFTSSRIKTQDKFAFTYGRIEARAKLPTGVGTWPAIWSLGSNIDEVGWPACGEIDIMEHVGKTQDVIYGTAHYPGRSGGNADGGELMVAGVSTDFHIYAVEWDASTITFSVDGMLIHTIANNSGLPMNADFFLLMNVAMGGNFGGPVDASFTESTMEVDYIRVYQ